jgi:lipid-A-disaccharide synthase
MRERPLKIMIVAGEASGDAHAARLVSAIREKRPQALFFGRTAHAGGGR